MLAHHPLGPLPRQLQPCLLPPARPLQELFETLPMTMPPEGPEPCGSLGTHVAPDTASALAPRQTCSVSIMRPYRGQYSSAHRTDSTPDSLSCPPMLGSLLGTVWLSDAAGTLPTGRTGQGRRAWWVVLHRAQLGSLPCSDPRGTPTFGTSGSRWQSG